MDLTMRVEIFVLTKYFVFRFMNRKGTGRCSYVACNLVIYGHFELID